MAGIRRLFRKSRQNGDCVVADAVTIEPISVFKFPGNREKYRENNELGLAWGPLMLRKTLLRWALSAKFRKQQNRETGAP